MMNQRERLINKLNSIDDDPERNIALRAITLIEQQVEIITDLLTVLKDYKKSRYTDYTDAHYVSDETIEAGDIAIERAEKLINKK